MRELCIFSLEKHQGEHLLSLQVSTFLCSFAYKPKYIFIWEFKEICWSWAHWKSTHSFFRRSLAATPAKFSTACMADWKTRERRGNYIKNSWEGLQNTAWVWNVNIQNSNTNQTKARQEIRRQWIKTLKWGDSCQDCAGNHPAEKLLTSLLKWTQCNALLPSAPKEKGRE